MSWDAEFHMGELRPWPDAVHLYRGLTLTHDMRRYLPATTATRRIRSHDGIGRCTCSECGGSVGTNDKFCKHCRAEFVGSEYEGER